MGAIGAGVVAGGIGSVLIGLSSIATGHPNPIVGLLVFAVCAADVWIGIALGVKRGHDPDKSGWFRGSD